jgi:hypothetical protein
MTPYSFSTLISPAIIIFLATLLVVYSFTKWPASALFAAFFKSLFFTVYFSFFFDGTYTHDDSWAYIDKASSLDLSYIDFSNLSESALYLSSVAVSEHFFYIIYTKFSFIVFGEKYYSPMVFNILATLLIAYFGINLVRVEFPISHRALKILFLFLMFQPSMFFWSNFYNGKDVIVILLHIFMLTSISLYFRGKILFSITLAAITFLLFSVLRFYLPVVFVVAVFIGISIHKPFASRRQIIMILITPVVIFSLIMSRFDSVMTHIFGDLVNPFYGMIRFVLTPIPFNTADAYAFLHVPSLFHWFAFPFLLFGMVHIWSRKTLFSKIFISYIFVLICLYSFVDELQGPRHRLQLEYAIAIGQFLGFVLAFKLRSWFRVPMYGSRAQVLR